MRKFILNSKQRISGSILIPSSKSYAQRAIALAALGGENIILENISFSEDVGAALAVVEKLGIKFSKKNASIYFETKSKLDGGTIKSIDISESGLSARMFSAFSLLYKQKFIIQGNGSILNRSMQMVIDGLNEFGKNVESKNGKLPIRVTGELINHTVHIDGSDSSQFLTGLLLVAPFLSETTEIYVKNLKSKPYIAITLQLLEGFGLKYECKDWAYFKIDGNQQVKKINSYTIEGDWSSASVLLVAGAIGGQISIGGLLPNSKQGDSKILKVLELVGATIYWKNNLLTIEKNELKPFEFDATDCPDLFPALVVLATFINGISRIKGANRLKNKESNRAIVLQTECKKVGIAIAIEDDTLCIYGNSAHQIPENLILDAHNDHRIAMAMSLFSVGAQYPITILGSEAVNKSYPDFWKDFDLL